jgi:D-alanyl-lipoteichoic acid acyltransferase DltB (MBOAT superfamily)
MTTRIVNERRREWCARLDRAGMVLVWILTGSIWVGVVWLFIEWRRLEGEA